MRFLTKMCNTFMLGVVLFSSGFAAVNVSIPDVTANSGDVIDVPINVSDLTRQNVYSIGIELGFSSSVLLATEVKTAGTIAGQWGSVTSNLTAGNVLIGSAGSSPLTGSGQLLIITFQVNGAPGTSTSINFNKMIFNEGDPTATTDDGSVTVSMQTEQPVLAVNPSMLNFYVNEGEGNPDVQSISITNSGTGTLNWETSDNMDWLSLSSTSGTAPSTVSVNVNATGLSAGQYSGTISVSSNDANNSPQIVSVMLTISEQTSETSLVLSPSSMTFNYTIGAEQPSSQIVSVSHQGETALDWVAQKNEAWLKLSQTIGSTPSGIDVSVNTLGLGVGTFTDVITISANEAINSPQTVSVTLYVNEQSQPDVHLSIPDTTADNGDEIHLPVYTTDLTGLNVYSYGLKISYDPSVLTPKSVITNGCVSEGWGAPTFWANNGVLMIGGAGSLPLDGEGCLSNIVFEVIGVSESSTELIFTEAILNEGEPECTTKNGSVTVNRVEQSELVVTPKQLFFEYEIGGESPRNKTVIVSHVGENSLNWSLANVPSWLTASPTSGSTEGSILLSLKTDQLNPGTYIDSLKIEAPNAKNSPQYVKISLSVKQPAGDPISVSIPDTIAHRGDTINLPVYISDVANHGVYSLGLTISYNSAIIEIKPPEVKGCLTETWNGPYIQKNDNEIIIATAGTTPLTRNGILFYLPCSVWGLENTVTPFNITECILNEGNPTCLTTDGSITITQKEGPKILFSLPSITSATDTMLNVPLTISDVTDRDVYAYGVELLCDSTVVQFQGANSMGTVSNDWGNPVTTYSAGRLVIGGAGASPLSGEGALVYIQLKVVGEVGQSSNLQFINSVLNEGSPQTETSDGKVVIDHLNSVKDNTLTVTDFKLEQNYPNPFNPATTITFYIKRAEYVKLSVYDLNGKIVKNIVDGFYNPGSFSVVWNGRADDGKRVPSNIYYYKIETESFTDTKKMLLIK